jgi:4-amino-4-deoxy-L-arabinose transferase-like glycosyltransferase
MTVDKVPARPLDAPDQSTAQPFDRRVILIGGALFAVLMAVSARYGFQRDELYFLDCARHLQLSYVDQSALAPLLTWVALKLFGVSVIGVRLFSALAAWGVVVFGGLTARELGGDWRAQLLAAIATALMPVLAAAAHVANTTAYVFLAWSALAWVVARIGRTGDRRWWLAGGLAAGIGVADSHLVAFFAIAVTIGALLSRGRREILNRWFAGGVLIAIAFEVPDLWWQATHGWATIEMTRHLNQQNGGLSQLPVFVAGQLIMVLPPLIGLWLIGLRFLWRSGRPLWRALVWAWALLFVLFAVTTGAQFYYLAGSYVYLLAAGAVAGNGRLAERRGRRILLTTVTVVVALGVAVTLLPILPMNKASGSTLAETIGWPSLVGQVRTVWDTVPPAEQARTVIVTDDYAEAAAINELGRGTGLPTAVSSQNNEWWWGPGNPDATTLIVVAPGGDDLTAELNKRFASVRTAATITNPVGIHNIEWGGHIYLCTGPHEQWGRLWPQLRHYD